MDQGEMAYLAMVIAAFLAFAITLAWTAHRNGD